MSVRARALRLVAGLGLLGALVLPGTVSVLASSTSSARAHLDHVFVIMLENHGATPIVGDPNAPNITALATKYGQATSYFGVTHPSEPNYVAAISGSNWFVNDDNPANRFDHENLVDQLEASGHSWAAYMESMPANDKLVNNAPGTVQLYVSKHNPFVLFDDIRNDAARLANVKPYSDFQADLDGGKVADFVWISPNQCHDMHGGVNATIDPGDGTPCPFGTSFPTRNAADESLVQKADDFVGSTVDAIMRSKAWTGNSAIFIVADETDFDGTQPAIDDWASAAGCCDSPILPDGYHFLNSAGIPDGNVLDCPNGATSCTYGGGPAPAVIVTTHGARGLSSDTPYNHYSLLRTIEENWHLGYLENASDSVQVQSMDEFLAH